MVGFVFCLVVGFFYGYIIRTALNKTLSAKLSNEGKDFWWLFFSKSKLSYLFLLFYLSVMALLKDNGSLYVFQLP